MSDPQRLRAVPTAAAPERRLDSWKEIAGYLNRTIRTAARWERNEGLPVHRHGHHKRGSVYALTSEIDAWWKSRQVDLDGRDRKVGAVDWWSDVRTSRVGMALLRPWVGASVLLLVILLAAGLWYLRRPVRVPLSFAMRDWVLVTDFTNQTGEPIFERSLWTAFTIGLQQSRHVNILPRARIEEALRRMERNPETRIDEALGREISLRENLKGFVVCDIAKFGQRYLLSARLVDPHSGVVVRAYSERARDQDAVLDALGGIAASLREDLGESLAAIRQSSLPLPQVTTPSLQALELYAEGLSLWRKGAYREAVRLYESAVQSDSCFAMAHGALGTAYCSHIFSDPVRGKGHYEKALQCAGRITERERLLIQASYQSDLGPPDQAVQLFDRYLASYPDDVTTRYNYGSLLMRSRRPEQAIEQLKEVVRLAPTHARAFINLATAYRALGRSDQAGPYYDKAFELEPGLLNVANVVHEYGFGLVHSGNPGKAREVFEIAAAKAGLRSSACRSLALLDMYEGRYADAKVRLEESILQDEAEKDILKVARGHLFMSMLLDGKGDRAGCRRELDRAAQWLESLKEPQDWLYMRIGALYARAGSIASAERILRRVEGRVDRKSARDSSLLNILEGEVALARGDHRRAVESMLLADRTAGTPETLASLANACDRAGDTRQAIENYGKLIAQASPALGWEPQQAWIAAQVRLAEIYSSMGDNVRAAASLDSLARQWANADHDLPLAKRMALLRSRMHETLEVRH